MKRVVFLILLIAVFATGCSYKVTSNNSRSLEGENEDWKAECQIYSTAVFPEKDGELFAKVKEGEKITVTCKNGPSFLSDARHIEISYEDAFGNGGCLTSDYDSPPTEKKFRLGGSSSNSVELAGYLAEPENLHKAIMIYGGPNYEMRNPTPIAITIQIDSDTAQTIQLIPAPNPSPYSVLGEQITSKLKKRPFLTFLSGRAFDPSLKLVKYRADVGHENAIPELNYDFTIRNEGRKLVPENPGDLQVKLIPGERLKEALKEYAGVNIPDNSSLGDIGLDSGQSMEGDLFNPDKDCKLTLSFDLGTNEENLKKILDDSSDASLIILYKDAELARFNL